MLAHPHAAPSTEAKVNRQRDSACTEATSSTWFGKRGSGPGRFGLSSDAYYGPVGRVEPELEETIPGRGRAPPRPFWSRGRSKSQRRERMLSANTGMRTLSPSVGSPRSARSAVPDLEGSWRRVHREAERDGESQRGALERRGPTADAYAGGFGSRPGRLPWTALGVRRGSCPVAGVHLLLAHGPTYGDPGAGPSRIAREGRRSTAANERGTGHIKEAPDDP